MYFLALLPLAIVGALAQPTPEYSLKGFTYGGTGCPAGTVSLVQDGNNNLKLSFTSFNAAIKPGVPIVNDSDRANCQLNFDIRHPEGWSFAPSIFPFTGYTKLDEGATITLANTYYFSGHMAQANTRTRLSGPIDTGFTIKDTIPRNRAVWSPCNRSTQGLLNINLSLLLTASNDKTSAYGEIFGKDGLSTQDITLNWRPCYYDEDHEE